MSQRYEKEGYVTESLGPVTFRAATIGLAGVIAAAFVDLQDRFKGGGVVPNPLTPATATASPTPTRKPVLTADQVRRLGAAAGGN